MQPFERLRAIARHGGDDRLLVAEAADCLGEFDDDPAALVVTCRRLLHHHPERAPLWWLCARVLAAPEPSEAAWDAEALVRDDHTADRLAGAAPLPRRPSGRGARLARLPPARRSRCVPTSRCSSCATTANAAATSAGAPGSPRSDASARPVDLVEAVALEPSHLLVEVVGAGPEQLLVAEGTADALATLARPGLVVWLVAGVGRVLPGPAVRRDGARAWAIPRTTASSCSTCRSPTASPAPPVWCGRSTSPAGSTARWRPSCCASADGPGAIRAAARAGRPAVRMRLGWASSTSR